MISLGDVLGADYLSDPYPFYANLREHEPISWHPGLKRWLVARYVDVEACFRDARLSSDRSTAALELRSQEMQREVGPVTRAMRAQLAFCDPPDHTRLRGLVNHAMTPKAVLRFKPFIEASVAHLLDVACQERTFDLVAVLADPLPAQVICEMMGLPATDAARFARWSAAATAFLENLTADQATDRAAVAALFEASVYMLSAAQHMATEPRGDTIMSLLVEADEDGDKLSTEELFCNAILLLSAGLETTTHLIANGVLSLMRQPEQWERLKAEPTLINAAVEELARYESPFQYMIRSAAEDLEVGGTHINTKDTLMLLIGSANRDPDAFDQPDVLDICRTENRHLAFGRGSHFCIGAGVARLEAQVALRALIERLPTLRLVTNEVEWKQKFEFRGVTALPVTW